MPDDEFGTEWNKSAIFCPDCSGDCLTNGRKLSCVECPFETTAGSPQGKRLIKEYYGDE